MTLWWRVRRGSQAVAQKTDFMRLMGRDPEGPYDAVADAATSMLPASGLALGWWWPELCFHGYAYGGYRYGHGGGFQRGYGHPSGDSSSYGLGDVQAGSGGSSSSGPSSSTYSSSETASNWRNPSADSGGSGSSSSDSSKSAWRR